MKKFIINVNGKDYNVEVTEVSEFIQNTETQNQPKQEVKKDSKKIAPKKIKTNNTDEKSKGRK